MSRSSFFPSEVLTVFDTALWIAWPLLSLCHLSRWSFSLIQSWAVYYDRTFAACHSYSSSPALVGQHWTCLVTFKHPGYLVGPNWGIFELWAQKTRKWTLTPWLFTPLTPLASPKQWQVLDQVLFITTVIKEKLWDPKCIWFIFTDAGYEVMINADKVPRFCYGRFNFYENLCGLCKAVVFFFGPFLYFVFFLFFLLNAMH